MSDEAKEGPKIIVDDDWKSKVQAEKEKAKTSPANEAPKQDPPPRKEKHPELPPASFETLVSMLASQAVSAMGPVAYETGKPPEIRLDYAKHFIDMLAVMETKSKGNLDGKEAALIDGILHELRMMFLAATKSQGNK